MNYQPHKSHAPVVFVSLQSNLTYIPLSTTLLHSLATSTTRDKDCKGRSRQKVRTATSTSSQRTNTASRFYCRSASGLYSAYEHGPFFVALSAVGKSILTTGRWPRKNLRKVAIGASHLPLGDVYSLAPVTACSPFVGRSIQQICYYLILFQAKQTIPLYTIIKYPSVSSTRLLKRVRSTSGFTLNR